MLSLLVHAVRPVPIDPTKSQLAQNLKQVGAPGTPD
jgi:hypothetical protein